MSDVRMSAMRHRTQPDEFPPFVAPALSRTAEESGETRPDVSVRWIMTGEWLHTALHLGRPRRTLTVAGY